MKHFHAALFIVITASLICAGEPGGDENATETNSITHYGITWKFDKPCKAGTFLNGDHWVVGPVNITSISNDLHAPGFAPKKGQDGSMINPGTADRSAQGYDCNLGSYREDLNAALPGGKPISSQNPLRLEVNQTLISMVSWLYESKDKTEPGCPRFNGGTGTPRPATRSASLLTCLPEVPPPGSFRPPYAGNDKAIKFDKSMIKFELLKNLPPVGSTPKAESLEKIFARTWIDHVYEYAGAFVHPSDNMPEYGRELGNATVTAALAVNLDFGKLPGNPTKDKIVIGLVQYGIDLAGIADSGGGWPANGGHHLGRKWPILFAGLMLEDRHMKDAGKWNTRFQEDEQTFYVTQKEVDITHSPNWKPDKRAKLTPYEEKDIGTAEWGIRHAKEPQTDNADWSATYRAVNGPVFPGFALVARIMEQKEAWNHDAFFDYCDRYMKIDGKTPKFTGDMWKACRKQF